LSHVGSAHPGWTSFWPQDPKRGTVLCGEFEPLGFRKVEAEAPAAAAAAARSRPGPGVGPDSPRVPILRLLYSPAFAQVCVLNSALPIHQARVEYRLVAFETGE